MSTTVLVTGGNGFIGRNIIEQLLRLDDNYRLLAPTSSQLDLLDYEKTKNFFKNHKIDVIVHCATWDASRISTKDQNLVLKNNLKMFFNIVNARDNQQRIITFGSGAEYGRYSNLHLVKEIDFGKIVPDDDYGFSKFIISSYAELANNIYVLRLFGVFGKYEKWEIRFISNACCKAIFNIPIKIKQNVFFDYLYVNDLVKILDWFIKNSPKHKIYNVCTGKRIDLITIANYVKEIANKPELEIVVEKEGLQPEYTGDNKRLLSEINNFSFTNIKDAIKELYEYYLGNKQSINKEKLLLDL